MKIKKKILYIIAFLLFFICIGANQSKAGNLKLNNLDFQAQINADGSMDVTETWDINIKSTNTLYKTFKTDNSKYSGITNATVTDITNGIQNNFIQTSEWAYHVAKGYYYGTENDDDDFEIGWGVGLDNSSARREYKISYTVKDAITKYNDYAELYWQFVGSTFEVDANKITGTILLPSNVDNKDEIKVWGHTKNLNGTIYATDTNKIEFEVDNFKNGTYVEVRTLFPTNLITTTGRIKNKNTLDDVVKEETKWANKANASRKRQEWLSENLKYIYLCAIIGVNILLIILLLKRTIKYWKKLKSLKKFESTTKLEYYRDLPDENSTPGEAFKTLNEKTTKFTAQNFGKIFSATVLDLTLKGYIEIQQEKKTLGKDIVTITLKKQVSYELPINEGKIMAFIIKVADNKTTITLKELEKYIRSHPSKIESLLTETYSSVDNQLIGKGIISSIGQKEYKEYKGKAISYISSTIFFIICMSFLLGIFIIPLLILIINAILCSRIAKKINILTQKGVDTKEQWKGLKKYMEDFSLLKEREVPELVIWEKYLVYATVMGIADKVIKQLKIVYPNFEEMTNSMGTYTCMNVMMHTDFSSSFSSAISSSITSATASSSYSSGSGGGGGFSGGGGRRWWPEEAEEEDNSSHKNIKKGKNNMSKPIVAIIGKPNVGKSTFFNYLAGSRISIVQDTPGVTRDRIYAETNWRGRNFTLIDTGGIEPDSDDIILSQMREQANLAIAMADVIIFLTDIKQGVTAADREISLMLKKSGKPIVLVCNKADNYEKDSQEIYEFYNLGIGEPFAISATNALGIGDVLDAIYEHFPEKDENEEEKEIIKVAVIGKPNVGKSSLINKILGEKRNIVSDIAGTTRDAIDSPFENEHGKYVLIDTAGIRKKSKVNESIEKYSVMRSLLAVERADVCLMMIDANDGVTEQDAKIAGEAHEAGKGVIIVVNKWDEYEKTTGTLEKYKKEVYNKLSYLSYAPVIFISAKTGQRVDKLFEMINNVAKQNALRVSTSVLNQVINEAIAIVQPPTDKGRRLKIFYGTQVSTKPPTFVIFVNNKELFHFSYQRYLVNQIRKEFGLEGTPVRIIAREKNEKYAEQ